MYEFRDGNYDVKKKINVSKQLIAALLGVGLLILSVIGASFAFFTYSKSGTKDNVITAGSISFAYSEGATGITLTNAFPMSDASGLATDPYQFTVSGYRSGAAAVSYTITAVAGDAVSGKSRAANSMIKINLTGSGSNGTLVSYPTAPVSSLPLSLGTGTITSASSTTHTYSLRMWVSDAVVISDTDTSIPGKTVYTTTAFSNLYYSIKINVSATST
jgi:hypothetical protein